MTPRKKRPRRMVAAIPRSATNATQSLLGHGFIVIPGSDSFIDGSLDGARVGYSTAQLPGPTPKSGWRTARPRVRSYGMSLPFPLPPDYSPTVWIDSRY